MVSWIWLNPKQYPDWQETIVNPICKGAVNAPFAVAEFRRTFPLKGEACSLVLRVSGDAAYRIWVNEHMIGQGPPSSGGDFLCDDIIDVVTVKSCAGRQLKLGRRRRSL